MKDLKGTKTEKNLMEAFAGESMARNLAGAGGKVKGGVLAEPAYILLGEAGVNDGHEVIRKKELS